MDISHSSKPAAVFLSYAREDTDAARRIAEALRSQGVEVWFDQNELRGGDAWDGKIKKHIRECALFVPIISATTQDRAEGYFRREWKLAVDRSSDIAHGIPFILPVVIDSTREEEALVPEEFMRVQWVRLASALPSEQFVGQVKRVLEAPRRPNRSSVGHSGSAPPRGPEVHPPQKRALTKFTAISAIVVIALVTFAYFVFRPRPADTALPSDLKSKSPNAAPRDLAATKSIAILPFTNMSDDRESGFFADGVHEDILTSLYLIPDLKVTSRPSVERYRDTKKSMREIGQELGVTYILVGSVRRDGKAVGVTGHLIHAASDEHLWAKRFDREWKDLFSIQSELAQAIATELQAKLSPEAKKILERRPTENPAAYDLLLKARLLTDTDRHRESLLQAAVVLDPNFALAWADLAWVHGWAYIDGYDHSAVRLAKAKAAIDTAIGLAPDAPEVILNLGYYHYFCHRDYANAIKQFEIVARLQPNAPSPPCALGLIQRRQGKWVEALKTFRSVAELDPLHPVASSQITAVAIAGRCWEDAVAERRRRYSLAPNPRAEATFFAKLAFSARGSTREMEAVLAGLPFEEARSPHGLEVRMDLALMRGDLAEIVRVDPLLPMTEVYVEWRAILVATALAGQGDLPGARARLEKFPSKLRAQIALEPENATRWAELGMVEAVLGHKEEALRCARKAVELEPESVDAVSGPWHRFGLAFVYSWTGDKENALVEYTRLLSLPFYGHTESFLNVHKMKRHPHFFPLQGDPQFEALLNDPKNNAPLF